MEREITCPVCDHEFESQVFELGDEKCPKCGTGYFWDFNYDDDWNESFTPIWEEL